MNPQRWRRIFDPALLRPRSPLLVAAALALCFTLSAVVVAPAVEERVTDSNEAWKLLKEGNQRFRDFKLEHPHLEKQRRNSLTGKQEPFAIILACADSRVPPELVFDQGLGDIFVIRTAGHVLDKAALATIEYGVSYLEIPLLVVLGHGDCGAVSATIASPSGPPKAGQAYAVPLLTAIRPAVNRAKKRHASNAQLLDVAIRENIALTIERLKTSRILAEAIKKPNLKIVGAYYDVNTGAVDITVP